MSLTPDIERVLDVLRPRVTLALIGWYTRSWTTPPDPAELLAKDPGSYVCVNAVDEAEVAVRATAAHLAALLGQHVEAAKREAWEEGYLACQDGKQQQADNPYRAGGGAAGGGES